MASHHPHSIFHRSIIFNFIQTNFAYLTMLNNIQRQSDKIHSYALYYLRKNLSDLNEYWRNQSIVANITKRLLHELLCLQDTYGAYVKKNCRNSLE